MKTNSTIAAEAVDAAITRTTIKSLKPGDFFKLAPSAKTVYIRGAYDRSEKKYECQRFDDISVCIYCAGSRAAYTDFTF